MLDERTTSTTGSAADLTASVPDDPQHCRADGVPDRHAITIKVEPGA